MATTQDRINGLLGDLGVKPPVLVATTAPITLSGEQTIDGVAIVAEDRVLVKNQVDQTTNGIYYCQLTTWVRAPDFDGVRDCLQGTLVSAATGTVNARTLWALTTADPVIGTSNIVFVAFTPLTASAFIQTLLDDTTAAAARTTLGAEAAFPTGTVLSFFQAAAPTGWTKLTTHNNKAMRVVSGTGGGSGGSVAFTTAFANQAVTGSNSATTLTTAQMPSHTHSTTAYIGTTDGNGFANSGVSPPAFTATTDATGGGGSHNHTFTGTAINLAVQYIDMILCSKD